MVITNQRSRVRTRVVATALVFVLASSVFLFPYGMLDQSSADSFASYERVLYLQEGNTSDSSDYDWLNSTGPSHEGTLDYDEDGLLGITIRKNLPSQRWRHFWVLDHL